MSWGLACCMAGCGSRSGLLGEENPEVTRPELAAEAPRPPRLPAPVTTPALPAAQPAPEPASALSGCVDITRSYVSVPATVLLLLIDQSQSMEEEFGTSTRWDVLRDAVVDPENGLLAWLDESAKVGLMLYTSDDGFRSGRGCPLLTRVDARLGNAESIRAAYLAESPMQGGETPTAEGIDQAVLRLNAMGETGPRHILLLTDGLPDTCAQPNPQLGIDEATSSAAQAFAQGILLHPVGVSSDLARPELQALANAGAGKAPGLRFGFDAEAARPLYASTDPRELADQLKGTIGDVRSCNVDLETDVGPSRAFEGTLLLDGAALEFGETDGWTFVDADTLEIHGAACQRILGEGERLQVSFPCVSEFSPR